MNRRTFVKGLAGAVISVTLPAGLSKDSCGFIEYCLDGMDNEKEYFVDLKGA